jgi:hypothetical protein
MSLLNDARAIVFGPDGTLLWVDWPIGVPLRHQGLRDIADPTPSTVRLYALWEKYGATDDAWWRATRQVHREIAEQLRGEREGRDHVEPLPTVGTVRGRAASGSEVPREALKFLTALRGDGWDVFAVVYSKAWTRRRRQGADGKMADRDELAEFVSVRARRLCGQFLERTVAVWRDGRTDGAWWWWQGALPASVGIDKVYKLALSVKSDQMEVKT